MTFPKDFLWGAATASYQIEGAASEDGKSRSIWDDFCTIEGNICNADTGLTACDHYHRFREDIAIMKEMGLRAYRFSVAWTRLFSNGDSIPNEAGFRFYDELIDALLDAGIEPVMTLYHWDLPSALQEKGGFEWDGISDSFAAYAAACVRHFTPRVTKYCIINEPQCVVHLGYVQGVHAPGKHYAQEQTGHIMRNLLLCHAKADKAMREAAKCRILIGTATTGTLAYPSTDSTADIEMARKLSFPADGEGLAFSHNWFLDPIILGTNDIAYLSLSAQDMELIHRKPDFIGINVYNGMEADKNGYVKRFTGFPRTGLGWPVTPDVMNYGLRFLYDRYALPIYITENGTACNDRIYRDGKVHDADRIDFMEKYLCELEKAIENGCDIRGYFHWSLMDNFEWSSGYDPRFGLIYIDYRNQQRIWKDSAVWYRDFIQKH
jgi:beta-glucosidase